MVRIDGCEGGKREPPQTHRRRMASAVHQQAGPFRRSPGDARASVAPAVKKGFMHSSDESGAGSLQAWQG